MAVKGCCVWGGGEAEKGKTMRYHSPHSPSTPVTEKSSEKLFLNGVRLAVDVVEREVILALFGFAVGDALAEGRNAVGS